MAKTNTPLRGKCPTRHALPRLQRRRALATDRVTGTMGEGHHHPQLQRPRHPKPGSALPGLCYNSCEESQVSSTSRPARVESPAPASQLHPSPADVFVEEQAYERVSSGTSRTRPRLSRPPVPLCARPVSPHSWPHSSLRPSHDPAARDLAKPPDFREVLGNRDLPARSKQFP